MRQSEPEPGRLPLAMDHEAYEARQALPINKGIVPTRLVERDAKKKTQHEVLGPGF